MTSGIDLSISPLVSYCLLSSSVLYPIVHGNCFVYHYTTLQRFTSLHYTTPSAQVFPVVQLCIKGDSFVHHSGEGGGGVAVFHVEMQVEVGHWQLVVEL